MKNQNSIYYHATHPEAAYKIYRYGFRVDKELLMHGDAHGSGVYLSFNEKTLGMWGCKGGIGIKCSLAKRLKILSLSQGHEKSVIKYLKKEFGKGIIDGMNFHKAIPRNKQLTKSNFSP